jgi:hypothetical protein
MPSTEWTIRCLMTKSTLDPSLFWGDMVDAGASAAAEHLHLDLGAAVSAILERGPTDGWLLTPRPGTKRLSTAPFDGDGASQAFDAPEV